MEQAAGTVTDLRHYGLHPLALDRGHEYTQIVSAKPQGLWLSDGPAWADWCTGEEFRVDHLEYCAQVELAATANLLTLDTDVKLYQFTREYGLEEDWADDLFPDGPTYIYKCDWPRVELDGYDGILISPYHWTCRLAPETSWYYGWDVASACVWNLNVITTVTPSPNFLPSDRIK